MVAAVPLTTNTKNDRFDLTTTDLRNVAFGLFAALALIMVAGSFSDSGSASVSVLEDTAEKRFANPTIGIITVAGDGTSTRMKLTPTAGRL
jgi:hypothetical protein